MIHNFYIIHQICFSLVPCCAPTQRSNVNILHGHPNTKIPLRKPLVHTWSFMSETKQCFIQWDQIKFTWKYFLFPKMSFIMLRLLVVMQWNKWVNAYVKYKHFTLLNSIKRKKWDNKVPNWKKSTIAKSADVCIDVNIFMNSKNAYMLICQKICYLLLNGTIYIPCTSWFGLNGKWIKSQINCS